MARTYVKSHAQGALPLNATKRLANPEVDLGTNGGDHRIIGVGHSLMMRTVSYCIDLESSDDC